MQISPHQIHRAQAVSGLLAEWVAVAALPRCKVVERMEHEMRMQKMQSETMLKMQEMQQQWLKYDFIYVIFIYIVDLFALHFSYVMNYNIN